MRPTNLRLLVVDEHALMRDVVRSIVEEAEGLEVVGEADTVARALRLVDDLTPDLVLVDISLPDGGGLASLAALRRHAPEARIVVFSDVDDPEPVRAALAHGAAAYVLKRINPLDLAATLRQTVEGSVFHRTAALGADRPPAGLSPKELDVLRQLVLGRSNREIARALWISDQTVKFHLRNVYRKLGASTRTEAMRIAHERALVAEA